MANHAAFLQRYWPISNGHRYRRPQRRHHSGQLKDPHRGDVHQRLLVSKNSGRSQVAKRSGVGISLWTSNGFIFRFFFLKLAFFASFSSWKKVGNLDVEAVQRPFNATKLQGAWEIPSARRRVEATQFDLGVPAESGRLIGWFSDPLLNCNIYIYCRSSVGEVVQLFFNMILIHEFLQTLLFRAMNSGVLREAFVVSEVEKDNHFASSNSN